MAASARLLIIEDHRVTLDGLQLGMNALPDVEVVGGTTTLAEGLALCRQLQPDVVLLDLHLPDSNGPRSLVETFVGLRGPKVVIFSAENRKPVVAKLMELGAAGFVSKSEDMQAVAAAVRNAVAGGSPYVSGSYQAIAPEQQEEQLSDPNIGTIVDEKYKIIGVLGFGGYSTVYRALTMSGAQTVALKIMHWHLVRNNEAVERFHREAQAARMLKHENICGVLDHGFTEAGQPYIVMEYVFGRNLESLTESYGKLPARRAVAIFAQICQALATAHQQGIIHRDVKPTNVFLTSDDKVKLIDFGLAKSQGTDGVGPLPGITATGEVVGTPSYMSPEQCLGKPLDVRSDIYSLGCLMYETLAGKRLVEAATVYDAFDQQVNAQADISVLENNKDIPRKLTAIVARCLRKNPAERYQRAESLEIELRRSFDEQPNILSSLGQKFGLRKNK